MKTDLNARYNELLLYYKKELKDNILPFWEANSLDKVNGGYFNCFTNDGKKLISRDKYTWSQGRFVWIWSKLAMLKSDVFDDKDRARFLSHAKLGIDFLRKHALLAEGDWRCTFLNDEYGNHKLADGVDVLNSSIYADCFVILGFSKFSVAANDYSCYEFAKKLYNSAVDQLEKNNFYTLPYPLSSNMRAHGYSMIFDDVTKELLRAAMVHDPDSVDDLKRRLHFYANDVLTNFVDENDMIHEVIYANDNSFMPNMLGQHINPGHTIEDMWFTIDAADILDKPEWIKKAARITKNALNYGWDKEFGGIFHFCGMQGGPITGSDSGVEKETMLKQALTGWTDKLWWVHSEALYTTLLLFSRTEDQFFMEWHDKILQYVEQNHINPDHTVGEWLQILERDGTPMQKVVALPVKDPYHITRNLALIIELLESKVKNKSL